MKKHKGGMKKFLLEKSRAEYCSVHRIIKRFIKIPEFCQLCKKVKPCDLANISGKYKKDITDWEYLCRKCHMIKDGRIAGIVKRNRLGSKGKGLIKYRGETAQDASIRLGGGRYLIGSRINVGGWDIKDAFTTPCKQIERVSYKGETPTDASRRLGGTQCVVPNRIRDGWSLKKAFTTPVRKRRKRVFKLN